MALNCGLNSRRYWLAWPYRRRLALPKSFVAASCRFAKVSGRQPAHWGCGRTVDASRHSSAGPAGHHPASHEQLPQPLQELILAIAIGYPDLVMVSNTTMNQTGQAIEGIAIFMLVYLGLSITISVFMNWYNSRVALKGR